MSVFIEWIKENAPDGATHYRIRRNGEVDYYIKHLNLVHYSGGRWEYSEYPVGDMKNLKVL